VARSRDAGRGERDDLLKLVETSTTGVCDGCDVLRQFEQPVDSLVNVCGTGRGEFEGRRAVLLRMILGRKGKL